MAKRQFSDYADCHRYASTHLGGMVSADTRQWRIRVNRYLRYNLNSMDYTIGSGWRDEVRIRPDAPLEYLTTNPNGCVLYDGPSRLDGKRIVAIMTGLTDASENSKTGKMLQTWIIRADRKPTVARKDGCDVSVCGDCPHRNGSCYVNLGQGPRAVYDCWRSGRGYEAYDPELHNAKIAGRMVRLGSYGDPAAVPIESFEPILAVAAGHTGYTHQWAKTAGLAYRDICMASVDTDEQVDEALSHGWRYFHARPAAHAKRRGEINCPASIEAGQKTQCNDCTLCFGSGDGPGKGSRRTPSVFIAIHGNKAQKSIYYNRTALAIDDSFSYLV